ncbi:penicillin-binding protein 1C [Aquimarina muelleri]|uniref:peptidoglycan glycosyltransferase n=1 Tax=Aquimarina muelleri TaxID=279356 RepID=A0A918JTM8_9FLAO|nr:penicillin-binding protein 1C [Aquimarina muelleri]MCX2764002.1 penicillin-binding protein 1C [Aquimarina muelleri]GGX12243.1 penicillin-binding protein 1C [Aquimarina muelleri]
MLKNYIRKHPKRFILFGLVSIWYYFSLPTPLFKDPTATVIETRAGELLGAKIAKDGQWRFPETDSVPKKFEQCIIAFEDQQFYRHFGFNPVAMGEAILQNIKAGKVVRGGSTITQQVIRLARKGEKRTYFEKLKELILATRLEFGASKENILKLYASHAPFGGNVVGVDMASWRYFGLPAYQLSWAESATLAVLPNAPSLIYPGKNQNSLLQKRNRLLQTLLQEHTIDSLTYELSIEEKLPRKPYFLPQTAPHLLERITKEKEGKRVQTTIDLTLQKQVNKVVHKHYEILKQNEVHNMAVLVLDVTTREVLSYVGNTPTDKAHQKDVDIIQAARSTGSVLKPLLYAAMMDKGELLPEQLVVDVPTVISGYSPMNYDEGYSGVAPANRALARSLNIPAVRLLQQYGLQRFRDEISAFKIRDLKYSADHYGLSLIVGGAEGNLWDLCKTYAGFAGTLNHYQDTSSEYFTQEFTDPVVLANQKVSFGEKTEQKPVYGAGSIWLTFEAMKEVNRPEGDEAWEFYDSSKEIAWKTGTSFGNRDAWAIGASKEYVVGVWIGNADGEGRPELTGVNSAAPVLFDVFNLVPNSKWFPMPYDDLAQVKVCEKSGYIASANCPVKQSYIPLAGSRTKPCSLHQLIHLDPTRQYRVNSSCEDVANIIHESWFVLPPLQEYFFKTNNADYQTLPAYRSDCIKESQERMDFIFPKANSSVYLPKGFDGKTNEVILKIAHTDPETRVFWYIDDEFVGTTKQFHEMPVSPKIGIHNITVLDEKGNELKRKIEIKE